MPTKHGKEEASNHGDCPYRSGNEGLFFLLIFVLLGRWFLWCEHTVHLRPRWASGIRYALGRR